MLAAVLLAVALVAADIVSGCDASCEVQTAAAMLAAGRPTAAIEQLRAARARFPDDLPLALLLVRAYVLENNLSWAERVLREELERHPDDARLRTWLASVHLRQGDLDLAREVLATAAPPPAGPDRARWDLLEAVRLDAEGTHGAAAAALAKVPPDSVLYPEDLAPWHYLQRRANPAWIDPVRGEVELAAGATSNALAGAPTDPGESGDASAVADLALRLGIVPPSRGRLRPTLAVDLSGHALQNSAYRDLGTLSGALGIGAVQAAAGSRTRFGYRAERLLINQDKPRYSEAHRLEVEVARRFGTVFFGGVGRRSYRDHRRTRWEADAGVGFPLALPTGREVMVGATARATDATSPAYDQVGVSFAASARWSLGRGFATRLVLTATWDDYPHSGGVVGREVLGSDVRRRDRLGRIRVTLDGPKWHGWRPALEWQMSRRASTLHDQPGADYSFRESRIALVARWKFAPDPWSPSTVTPPGHIPLEWGLGDGSDDDGASITELLRQDEELRRASSCGVR